MTFTQQLLTIGVVILGTMLTRFLPFLLFPPHKPRRRWCTIWGGFCRERCLHFWWSTA